MHSNKFGNIHFSNVSDATVNIFLHPVVCVCTNNFYFPSYFSSIFVLMAQHHFYYGFIHFELSQKFHFNLLWFDLISPLLVLVCVFLVSPYLFSLPAYIIDLNFEPMIEEKNSPRKEPLLNRSKWLIAYNVCILYVCIRCAIVNCYFHLLLLKFTAIIHSFFSEL